MRALIALSAGLALALIAAPVACADPPFMPPGHAKRAYDWPHGQDHSYDYDRGYGYDSDYRYRPRGKKYNHRRFSAQDVAIMLAYFSGQPQPWSTLPPGIAKNYARGKPLPPGIAKKHLPLSLEAQLPDYPGTRYYLVGRDVVLVDTTTRIVIDVLKNVFG